LRARLLVRAVICGTSVLLAGAALASRGVTVVRVGPTAAIGVACSAGGSIVYVIHGKGVFKSTDGGQDVERRCRELMGRNGGSESTLCLNL